MREAILTAALNQLARATSPQSVTIASVVSEAGCTPPSLYHYWPTRELLLHEASMWGWETFRAHQSAAASEQDDPLARLRARGQAYVEFSLTRPALFRVLFMSPGALEREPSSTAEPGPALVDLATDVGQAMSAGLLRAEDPFVTALALWSTVHGVAALWAVEPNRPRELAHAVAALAQDAVLTGLAPH